MQPPRPGFGTSSLTTLWLSWFPTLSPEKSERMGHPDFISKGCPRFGASFFLRLTWDCTNLNRNKLSPSPTCRVSALGP